VLSEPFRGMGAEEFHGNSIVVPIPQIWTKDQDGKRSAKDGGPERLRSETIQKEAS